MEYTCDDCYGMRHPKIDKCPKCGKFTFESVVEGWSAKLYCNSCGYSVISAGGFPQVCHVDDTLYALTILKPGDHKKLVKLAKLLCENVLDLKADFDKGQIERRFKVMEMLSKSKQIDDLGIVCITDPEIRGIYPNLIGCPFH
ncbi:MAG: hypothetical protein K6E75_12840 [Lachnospiraceae bacterium]|nr:hypothetical protein [Lachnospiraceae bacterium]